VQIADALDVRCIAEGVETAAEMEILRTIGIELFQGYLLARPEQEALPQPAFSAV